MNFDFNKNFIKGACFMTSLFVFGLLVCCNTQNKEAIVTDQSRAPYVALEQLYLQDLEQCIAALDRLTTSTTIKGAEACFLEARHCFKAIAPILSFIDAENYKFLNQPNILKVEEEDYTDIKRKQPQGFQVLEEAIFKDTVNIKAVKIKAKTIAGRLRLLAKNTQLTYLKSYHFLWMLRNAVLRVALTGVTGFDSPVLGNSLEESSTVYQSLKSYLGFFEANFEDAKLFTEWNEMLAATITQLQGDFVSFDRYTFLKNYTQPTLQLWTRTVADWNVVFPFAQSKLFFF